MYELYIHLYYEPDKIIIFSEIINISLCINYRKLLKKKFFKKNF